MLPKKKENQRFPIDLPREKIIDFCKKWKIIELSFFGSVVRDDFGPKSDIDVLVKVKRPPGWTLLDHAAAHDELSEILGRPVDLVNKNAIEQSHNEQRRRNILDEAQIYYSEEEAA